MEDLSTEGREKFYPDGSPRAYQGCSIICMLDPLGVAYEKALWVQKMLRENPFAQKLTFLPPPSFHMTVMGLISDSERAKDYWPQHLDKQGSLSDTEDFVEQALKGVAFPDSILMKCMGLHWQTTLGLRLGPANETTAKRLEVFRREAAQATGIHRPDHQTYEFHISLAYGLEAFSDSEIKVWAELKKQTDDQLSTSFGVQDLALPELRFFTDMHHFLLKR